MAGRLTDFFNRRGLSLPTEEMFSTAYKKAYEDKETEYELLRMQVADFIYSLADEIDVQNLSEETKVALAEVIKTVDFGSLPDDEEEE